MNETPVVYESGINRRNSLDQNHAGKIYFLKKRRERERESPGAEAEQQLQESHIFTIDRSLSCRESHFRRSVVPVPSAISNAVTIFDFRLLFYINNISEI